MQKLFRSSQSARPFAASVPLGSRSRHACRARWRSWPAARTRQPSAKTMPPATLTGYCIGTLCRLFSIEHVPLFFSGGSQAGRGTVENWKRRTWVACIWVSTFIQTLLGPRAYTSKRYLSTPDGHTNRTARCSSSRECCTQKLTDTLTGLTSCS
jgi:hypothetical protein